MCDKSCSRKNLISRGLIMTMLVAVMFFAAISFSFAATVDINKYNKNSQWVIKSWDFLDPILRPSAGTSNPSYTALTSSSGINFPAGVYFTDGISSTRYDGFKIITASAGSAGTQYNFVAYNSTTGNTKLYRSILSSSSAVNIYDSGFQFVTTLPDGAFTTRTSSPEYYFLSNYWNRNYLATYDVGGWYTFNGNFQSFLTTTYDLDADDDSVMATFKGTNTSISSIIIEGSNAYFTTSGNSSRLPLYVNGQFANPNYKYMYVRGISYSYDFYEFLNKYATKSQYMPGDAIDGDSGTHVPGLNPDHNGTGNPGIDATPDNDSLLDQIKYYSSFITNGTQILLANFKAILGILPVGVMIPIYSILIIGFLVSLFKLFRS